MRYSHIIKINFTGGIISPGDLMDILKTVHKAGISEVSFGLRQQLLIEVPDDDLIQLTTGLKKSQVVFETGNDEFPNIVSSYPAEEVFITKTWLSEGVYKDIFDSFDYRPKLKINISDYKQSFTPLFTGNINWVASANQHFWNLFIRFPKTNLIYKWRDIVYTNDVARMTKAVEAAIFSDENKFYDNPSADGNLLHEMIMKEELYITKPDESEIKLPPFMLPYYEGFNRYNDKYWLGIYRREEKFSVKFLYELCKICLSTKIGELCSTPWKSLIIKSIEEKDRNPWDTLLGKYQVNVRHAANELNFQVEDNCKDGLELKSYLIKHLHRDDTRTFGICIGIKTRRKSEVFCNILVRKRPLINIAGIGLFFRYDILCAQDFNPNERTGYVFSSNNFKWLLPEQLRCAIVSFYAAQREKAGNRNVANHAVEKIPAEAVVEYVHQCGHCLSVYDDFFGDPGNSISAGTKFSALPADYSCPLCEASKLDFKEIKKLELV